MTFAWVKTRIKQLVEAFLSSRGHKVIKLPKALIQNPAMELKIDLGYVIHHHLSRVDLADFFFVQIGAFDGVTNDPIHEFVVRYGWRGVLVEPQKEAFLALKENYRQQPQIQFLNVAISDRDGVRDFYRIRSDVEGLPSWSQQVASFDLDTVLRHGHGIPTFGIRGVPSIEALIEAEKVKCLTFGTLLDKTGVDRMDLLLIDAEGYDYEIVKMIDFERIKPQIICYEHMHLGDEQQEECVKCLVDQGYRIASEFTNTIAYLG